ncbi:BpuSI family type II restriction endonuclease [Sphingobacterium rhinopitheci]|uniref:BpuSI family type II restriction endonuclease n=1 Tax=Sphingobacterium rhinopitheci TaxID=2781960 RepID=UPI001F51B386|nr:BpuSI family type II restriction endonuclease [Sphingobacterium rhinopitheci]MCI0920548.1 BpuSI family type II restriction endonuclease [Sphingobacterium rhinopitheci]
MINLWYNSDEVTGFHPVVESAINNAIINCGYDSVMELVHHPAIPNSTIIPDFAIKLKSSNRYIFVIEVKKTARDVTSQRFQNQSRSYVSDFSPYWEPNYPKYFCLTNIEELILFADRQGPISTCILKGNPKSHTAFNPQNRDATQTSIEFQETFEQILPIIYNRTQPDWDNNWQPIIDTFVQNYQSVSNSLQLNKELADEITLYEFFRLLAFAYLKDYYNQTSNPNQSYFRTFPLANDNLQTFITKLTNNYNRVLQLDFNQVFSNHPNSTDRIFPENFSSSIIQYFKNTIQTLNSYSSQAVSDNPLPEYIFDLLTSKVYDKNTLHKKGKIMSDTELSILLATVTIENENSTVIDPCSGDGALLDAAYDYLNILSLSNRITKSHNQLLNQITGIEIDPFLAQLATFRLVSKNLSSVNSSTNANIITGNAFTTPNRGGYDVLLMNPPFLRNDNPDAPITIADKTLMNNAIINNGQTNYVTLASQPNLYFYFVNYSWHYLNYQGRAGLILMAKFLNNEEGVYLKQFILDKVETIILYPRNYFEDFKVTTVITVLSKQPTNQIKFFRIINSDLLSRPYEIKEILTTTNNTIVNANYTLKVTDRNIDPSANWKMFFNDPTDKFQTLDSLLFLEPLDTFFVNKRRGGAENSGGSAIIFPDFSQSPYSGIINSNKGYGIKNSRSARNLILEQSDLQEEPAIHFPTQYDDSSPNGLAATHQVDASLNAIFSTNNTANSTKWKQIVNAAFRNKVSFDILIPRAERTKHSCYYNPFSIPVVLSTNFFYLSGFQNGNSDTFISDESQIKFITAFLNSCFGQIQFEIHSNNQEGLRKLEGFHINEFKIPDLRQLTKTEIDSAVIEFENLNNLNISISGAEGLGTPRRLLDEAICKIIFNRNNLGFSTFAEMTDYFELFLADLVEDRRI